MDTDSLRPEVTTVTPTRRLAHWLRARHDEECQQKGLAVWKTPDVVAWSELIERISFAERDAGCHDCRWLPDASAVLVWERFVRADPATSALVAPGLLGHAAWVAWRRMHDYEVPLSALDRDERPEATAWVRWSREYLDWLRSNRCIDASQAAARLGGLASVPALELSGFDVLTPAQQSLVDRLQAAGCVVTRRQQRERKGVARWVACRDSDAELDVAVRWAAGRLDAQPELRLAIVVPGLQGRREQVRRSVEPVLAPAATLAGGPAPGSTNYEIAAARALSTQPLVAAALDLVAAFVQGGDLISSSRIVRSAFLAGAAVEIDARGRFDAWIRRNEAPDVPLAQVARLAQVRHCPLLGEALRAGLDVALTWPRRALPSQWSQHLARFLAVVGWPGDGLNSDEHQARERWQRLLTDLGSTDDCTGPMSGAATLALLRDQADGVLFEPQERAAALTIIDPETCVGMSFDALWVCGLDSARWPAPASPDPFVPRDWQARRGMPGATAEIALGDAHRMLHRLCTSADEIILSVPQFQDDAPLLPSSLLAGIARGTVPETWAAPRPAVAMFDVRPELERTVDGAMPQVERGTAAVGGSRTLELASACPFRAQAELRLGARLLEEPALGVAATERGDLVHRVLARIWNGLGTQQRLRALAPGQVQANIRDAVTAESTAALASTQGVMRRLLEIELAWLEARVSELLACELARGPFEVDSIERGVSLDLGGLSFALRVDRVDRLPDDSLAVIDYKTGGDADPSSWQGERPKLPQLPLYVEAIGTDNVSAVAFGRVRTGDTGFRGLARDAQIQFPGLASPGTGRWPKEHDSWQALQRAWSQRLAAIASEYAAGDARLAPNPATACRFCHLGALCRIGETAAAEEAGDD